MPFLRPDSLANSGGGGSWTGIVSSINEEVPNDSTLVLGPSGTSGTLHVSMSNPGQSQFGGTTGIARWRWAKVNGLGQVNTGNLVQTQVKLIKLSSGTNITTLLTTALVNNWITYEIPFNLSIVADFDDLGLRFEQNTASGTTPETQGVTALSWAEIELLSPRRVTIIL